MEWWGGGGMSRLVGLGVGYLYQRAGELYVGHRLGCFSV